MVSDSNAIESSSEKRSSIDRRKIHQGHFCRGQNTGVLSGTLQIPLGETGKTFSTMINTILVNTTYRTLNTKQRKRTRKKKNYVCTSICSLNGTAVVGKSVQDGKQ